MDRNIFKILFARWTSLFGDALHQLALPILLYQRTGSASLLAMAFLAETLPWVLVAPLFSHILARYSVKFMVIALDIARALLCLMIAFYALTPPQILLCMFLLGACSSLFNVFRIRLLTENTRMEQMPKILGIQTGVSQAISMGAPLIGAMLITIGWSAPMLFVIDASSYVLSGFVYLLVSPFSKGDSSKMKDSEKFEIGKKLFQEFDRLWSKSKLRNLLLADFARNIGEGLYQPLLIVLVVKTLLFSTATFGWVRSLIVLAEILSSFLFLRYFSTTRETPMFNFSTLLAACALWTMPFSSAGIPLLITSALFLGFGLGLRQLLSENIVIQQTNDHHQTPQISMWNAIISCGYIIGYGIAAILSTFEQIRILFIGCGILILLGLFFQPRESVPSPQKSL